MSHRRRPRHSRSRSPGPSQQPRRDYVPSSFRTPSDVHYGPSSHMTAETAGPSVCRRYTGHRNSRVSSSSVSRPFPRPSGRNPNLARATPATPSVGHYAVHPPSHPNHSDSTRQFRLSPPENTGMFYQPRDCTVTGTFVDASNVTYNASSNTFMKELLAETIRGAAHDSSARDPPPRCQPGTRLAILERCVSFVSNCDGVQKMRWVVGTAGVGKSAIMQSVAESPNLPGGPPASVFFSINGRDDGTKTITTLCYQLAAKSGPYRQVIENSIILDPSLLLSSMEKQFTKLIVEPLVQNAQRDRADRMVIIIDGLDECKNPGTQLELLRLISDLCLKHPSSPLVWLIASRPEPHITSFFSKPNIIPVFEKEEVPIDSDEARADVERFLRVELMRIKEESDSLHPQWPEERDFWKVACAAGGLFAYAQTVINYIGDRRVGSPASQLSDVLCIIDKLALTGLSRTEHPMAFLDALYERILSNVPDKIMINTRKLLLASATSRDLHDYFDRVDMSFVVLCNWLGMTADEAYAAVNHLRSVLYVPRRDIAHKENLRSFHKSFMDYIFDFTRSGLFSHILEQSYQLQAECSSKIIMHFSNGTSSHYVPIIPTCSFQGTGCTTLEVMPLTWPATDVHSCQDTITRTNLYIMAVEDLLHGIKRQDRNFWSACSIRFLASVWRSYGYIFPYDQLLNAAFDETRRPEFTIHGIIKPIPRKVIADSTIGDFFSVNLHFRCSATTVKGSCDPWDLSCSHKWREEEKAVSWKTSLSGCAFCQGRLKSQLEHWKTDVPDDTALVMFTSTDDCCVQVRLVDPGLDVSQWTYQFWCVIPEDVRKKYESVV